MNETTASRIDLAGAWFARVDPDGAGEPAVRVGEKFSDRQVTLPGAMDTHKLVAPATEGSLQGFGAAYPYEGCVWYRREIGIPADWLGKRVELFLERCQWESAVWVDGSFFGTANSLVGPHVYELSRAMTPGSHTLTIRVDNSNRKDRGEVASEDMTAHHDLTTQIQGGRKLNCGGHHLWSHNWVGILGEMALTACDAVRVSSLNVFPRIGAGEVRLAIGIANDTGTRQRARLLACCSPAAMPEGRTSSYAEWEVELTDQGEQVIERGLKLAEPAQLWDEFSPLLYEITVDLTGDKGSHKTQVRFGMRELSVAGSLEFSGSRATLNSRAGTQFAINGHNVFLRGTVENFIFPHTGHPPMNRRAWRKVLATAKSYGLNFFRFHTCCPPRAAFEAADEIGFYFQVELPGTSCPMTDESPEVDAFLCEELARILRWYGNHPSLLFVSMGNEQLIAGDAGFLARHAAVLEKKVLYGRNADRRHMYTSTTHPINRQGSDEFHVSAWPAQGQEGEPLCGIRWGGDRVIDSSRFNTRSPETVSDYREAIAGLDRPLITHEVGQWAVFPDLREIERYRGAERPFNFEIIRERLKDKKLLEWAGDFTRASGMLSLILYKEEIESALRTPGLAGFQLLGLTDYPGQGTSTIGILNALWESKGLTTPAKFCSFCGPQAPLARLEKRVWTTDETFTAALDFANYGQKDLAADAAWTIMTADGQIVANGVLPSCSAPRGGLARLGDLSVPLTHSPAPANLVLLAQMADYANSWDIWVYPSLPDADCIPAGIFHATAWDNKTAGILNNGGTVLLTPAAAGLREPVPGTFTTAFWNVQMKRRQVSKTMGLLCDPAHPALASFPTRFHSDWQWWDIMMHSAAMRMDSLPPALLPIVRVIDAFVENRRLGMIFEARFGEGRLLVCSAEITQDLWRRPAARQLRRSLLEYMAGPLFLPDVELTREELCRIFVEY